jgi:hypothetical protein
LIALLALACRSPEPTVAMAAHTEPVEIVEADVQWHREAAAKAAERVPDPARGAPWTPSASPLPPFLGVDRATAEYVGVANCSRCHAEEARLWGETAHARAVEPLVAKQASADPRCLRCHVTGIGHPSGWAGGDALSGVQCEACHGPGSDHVAAPAPGYGELPADGSGCVACHTIETSPDFRWEGRWERIAH